MDREYSLDELIDYLNELRAGSPGSVNFHEAIYILAKEIQKLKNHESDRTR